MSGCQSGGPSFPSQNRRLVLQHGWRMHCSQPLYRWQSTGVARGTWRPHFLHCLEGSGTFGLNTVVARGTLVTSLLLALPKGSGTLG